VPRDTKYAWEDEHYNEDDDPFLQQFDDDGNFIERPAEEVTLEQTESLQSTAPKLVIRYEYKKAKKDGDAKGTANGDI
jgi:hypothetical protein